MSEKEAIIIRQAEFDDYDNFRKMEEQAWQDSGIDVIGKEMFETWLKVFPEGFLVAEIAGEIRGHLYGQICDFDPFDSSDERCLLTMTDHMYTRKTHNANGNCLYSFSVSCTHAQAAVLLNEKYTALAVKLGKKYYSGAVRMPGLERYLIKNRLDLTKQNVHQYAFSVRNTVRIKGNNSPKVFDPVVTPLLKLGGSDYARVIEDFFPYNAPQNWGCVLYWENMLVENFK